LCCFSRRNESDRREFRKRLALLSSRIRCFVEIGAQAAAIKQLDIFSIEYLIAVNASTF